MMKKSRIRTSPVQKRRGGQVVVYVALMMPVLLGGAALAVDMSRLYYRQAQAQRAADAAALAGAWCNAFNAKCLVDPTNNTASERAYYYATLNGFTNGGNGGNIQVTPTIPYQGNANWFNVAISSVEPNFFGYIFGAKNTTIHASATALFTAYQSVPINGQQFGLGSSAVYNYSLFGPYAYYSYGDYTAAKYYDDTQGNLAGDLNPGYSKNGLNYFINTPTTASIYETNQTNVKTALAKKGIVPKTAPTTLMDFELYDPGTTDTGVDEIRAPYKTDSGYSTEYTPTIYTLYFDENGQVPGVNDPPNPSVHVPIAVAEYGDTTAYSPSIPTTEGTGLNGTTFTDPAGTTVANQWTTPPGFEINLNAAPYTTYPSGTFHLNVQAQDGSSENGWSLRAGPPDSSLQGANTSQSNDDLWQEEYGSTTVTTNSSGQTVDGLGVSAGSQDILPVNFNVNGTATIELGTIAPPSPLPTGANNAGTITVSKFDTDVGADSITYTMISNSGVSTTYDDTYNFQGSSIKLNNGNGVFSTDTIVLPTSFTGGTLFVNYTAGASDTSEWSMQYSDSTVSDGSIKLIQ